MIKSILVPATGTETDVTSLTTALKIARDFSAHIEYSMSGSTRSMSQ